MLDGLAHHARSDEWGGGDEQQLRAMAEEAPVVELVSNLMAQAVEQRASDIHLEPEERIFAVRFRIDGVLHTRLQLPRDRFDAVASRLKLISGMDIAERRLPQDGRLSTRVGGQEMDIRVSALPGVHGESIVMRLLPKERKELGLEKLGFESDHLAMMKEWTAEANGIVLVTGPTGSGKSTTLYASLAAANDGLKKIITVEDPVEFQLPAITQIQAHPDIGLTFANALRSILRQDPDVIMIGEIRDRNTMKQAIAYAETGHLCLSTLHANNANQAMERVINFFPEEAHRQLLVDLSLNLAGVVSQRLIPGLHEKLVPAVEVMLNSSYISDLIAKGEFSGIKEAMARSTEIGMCTFDQALYQLYTEDRISLDEALHNADSRTDLALRIRLAAGVSTQDAGDLSIDTSSPIQSAARLA